MLYGKIDIILLVRFGEKIEFGFEYNFFYFMEIDLRELECEFYVLDWIDFVYIYKKDCKLFGNLLV